MQIHVNKRSEQITSLMTDHLEEKLSKIDKLPMNIIDARVVLDIKGYRNFVEITLIGKNMTINAKDEDKDMLTAIDNAADKIENQLKKYKDMKWNHKGLDPLKESEIKIAEEQSEEEF